MYEALAEIGRAQQVMTWGLLAMAFLTLLLLAWSAYLGFLIRREGLATRLKIAEYDARGDAILREMREDSKRMQFYLFSKLGPAELK